MTIKELLIEADAIQVGVTESDWQKVIQLAASPLVAKGYISADYGQAVIDNTRIMAPITCLMKVSLSLTPGRNVASNVTASALWC